MTTTFDRLGFVVNSYDIARATGIPCAVAVTGRGNDGWAYDGTEYHEGGWDAMVAATGITRWVRAGHNIGGWFPIAIVEKAAAMKLRPEKATKITWTEGRPCNEMSQYGTWDWYRCERPVVGTVGKPGHERQVCAMHLRATERSQANDAARAAARAEDRARMDRNGLHRRLSAEVLEWAHPLLAELGIHPSTVVVGSAPGSKVGVLMPAEAVATLVEAAMGERYPGPKDPT